MVTLDDLKRIPLLEGISDATLEKMLIFTKVQSYEDGDIIFEENEEALNFYFIKTGKAILESDLTEDISVSLASIKPSYALGFYALTPGSTYNSRALCTEPSDVLVMPGEDVRELMEQDHTFGYILMSRMFRLMKRRVDKRTTQFLKILQRHPDLKLSE